MGARELAAATRGLLLRDAERAIAGGAVDSRRVLPGNAFFALPGERSDGHEYLADAVAHGAAALVVSRTLDEAALDALAGAGRGGVAIVRVDSGLAALHDVAADWRARFTPLVVGITGSLAKTSTKEAIAETLSVRWRVLRNEGNENNEVGLPLTLLRLSAEHEVAALEMGMYVPGEIATLARLARPTIGVVTAIRGTHLSRAGSIEAIERGKAELVEALPGDGTAILNADDPRVTRLAARTAARVIRYGFSADAEVRASDLESAAEGGMRFTLHTPAGTCPANTPALGRHSVHNALAAAAAGLAAGLNLDELRRGIARGFSAPHRTSLVVAGQWRILDDSYNAAPDSMAAALELLASLPGRRVAVLGEMLELGDGAADAHRAVGAAAAEAADLLVTVGAGADGIADGARASGLPALRVRRAADRAAALAILGAELRPGDVVLVKASRGAALEWIVEQLAAAAG